MKITLNNRPDTFDEDVLTIDELILKKNFTFTHLVTKLNGKVVKKEDRGKVSVKSGDEVTVLHLVSGG